jgi:hypothetical protein
VLLFLVVLLVTRSEAQSSSFTYQGRLTDGGTAATGNYDFRFVLFDSLSGGTQIGSTQTISSVSVSNGAFTVSLDFGASSFSGANRFLEISARPSGAGSFTLLTPRQQATATPYAIRSAASGNADTATNASQLGGVVAGQYVQTNDPRLSDARSPAAGSSNYIQTNPSSAQNASFNISGNGTASGNLTGINLIAGSSVGIGTANFLRPSSLQFGADINAAFTVSSTDITPNAGYIRFGDNTGWKLHFSRSREKSATTGGTLNTGTIGALLTIQDNGNVGLGNTAPSFRLHILDTSNTGLRVQTNTSGGTVASFGGNGDFQIDAVNITGGRFTVKEAGNVGIGTAAPQTKLDVRGDIKLGSTGQLFAPGAAENLRILRGNLDQGGNIDAGAGFTATRVDLGDYVIHFNTAFAATPTLTANCQIADTNGICTVTPLDITTQSAVLFVFNAGNNFTDARIYFTVIGPR